MQGRLEFTPPLAVRDTFTTRCIYLRPAASRFSGSMLAENPGKLRADVWTHFELSA